MLGIFLKIWGIWVKNSLETYISHISPESGEGSNTSISYGGFDSFLWVLMLWTFSSSVWFWHFNSSMAARISARALKSPLPLVSFGLGDRSLAVIMYEKGEVWEWMVIVSLVLLGPQGRRHCTSQKHKSEWSYYIGMGYLETVRAFPKRREAFYGGVTMDLEDMLMWGERLCVSALCCGNYT